MIMDIVDRLKKCMEGNVRTKHNALLACASDEIQTLRAKVASAEVLVEALDMFVKDCTGEIIHSTNWMSQQGKKALATYNKLSEVKK